MVSEKPIANTYVVIGKECILCVGYLGMLKVELKTLFYSLFLKVQDPDTIQGKRSANRVF